MVAHILTSMVSGNISVLVKCGVGVPVPPIAQSDLRFLAGDFRESLNLSEICFLISPGEYGNWILFKEFRTKQELRNGCYY